MMTAAGETAVEKSTGKSNKSEFFLRAENLKVTFRAPGGRRRVRSCGRCFSA